MLQSLQLRLKVAMTQIIAVEIFPALFALKHRNGGFALQAAKTNGGDVYPESGARSSHLHCATAETTIIRPKECQFFEASVRLRFAAGKHDLFLVTVFREPIRSAEIHRNVVVESPVEMNRGQLSHGV